MAVCKWFLQGHCKFGNRCHNEHPAAGPNHIQARNQNQNRFGALSNGANAGSRRNDAPRESKYKVTPDSLKIDLTSDKPIWPFSSYGPGRDAPRQLIEGDELDQSFEEMRLQYYMAQASNNPQALQAAQQYETVQYQKAITQVENILNDLEGACQYVDAGEHVHPNRFDVCKQGSNAQNGPMLPSNPGGSAFGAPSAPSAFGRPASGFGAQPQTTAPQGTAFGQPSAFGAAANQQSAFGKPSAFGAAAPQTGGAFGQPSALGGGGGAFGKPAFGAPSAFGQASAAGSTAAATPAFGQSGFGKPAQPAFGQPAGGGAFGQPAGTGAFGKPVQTPAFGQSAFGQPAQAAQPSQPANTGAFGQPAQPAFGQAGGGAFGKPAQAPAFGQAGGGAFGQPATTGAFGKPVQTPAFGQSAFGQASTPATSSPFGQSTAPQQPTGAFGQPAAPQQSTQQSAGAFGQSATPQQPGGVFGKPATTSSPFGSAPSAPTAPSAFGAPQNNGFGAQSAAPPTSHNAGAASTTGSAHITRQPNGILSTWKGQQVIPIKDKTGAIIKAKDGTPIPGHRNPDGSTERIFHPNGPPQEQNIYTAPDPKKVTEALKEAYDFAREKGVFKDGIMPEEPPLVEWVGWDV